MRYVNMYRICFQTAVKGALAYRSDFLLRSMITLLSNILFPLVTVLIYALGAQFPGWNMWEVLLLQSIYSMSTGAAAVLFGNVLWATMDHVQQGSFETVLLKPVSPLFYLITANFDLESNGLFLGGLAMTVVCGVKSGSCSWENVPAFVLFFLGGLAVMSGMFLLMAAVSFKWVGNSRIPEIFDSIKSFGKYPAGIFPKKIQILCSFIIPVAVIGFFPAGALMGRMDNRAYVALLPCVLFFVVGVTVYHGMIRLYEGVGG